MNKKRLIIAIISVFTLIIIGAVLYTFRPNPDSVRKVKPDFTLSSNELFSAFEENESTANKLYLDKVIQVKGIVSEVTFSGDENTTIYLEGGLTGNVSCSFIKNEFSGKELKQGELVSIKGKCTGFILDVVLTKCCLVND